MRCWCCQRREPPRGCPVGKGAVEVPHGEGGVTGLLGLPPQAQRPRSGAAELLIVEDKAIVRIKFLANGDNVPRPVLKGLLLAEAVKVTGGGGRWCGRKGRGRRRKKPRLQCLEKAPEGAQGCRRPRYRCCCCCCCCCHRHPPQNPGENELKAGVVTRLASLVGEGNGGGQPGRCSSSSSSSSSSRRAGGGGEVGSLTCRPHCSCTPSSSSSTADKAAPPHRRRCCCCCCCCGWSWGKGAACAAPSAPASGAPKCHCGGCTSG